jgi:hypothetical protein
MTLAPDTTRLDALTLKIDAMLRTPESLGAVFDVLPAWAAEHEAVYGAGPGTSGGETLLDHYLRDAGQEQGLYDLETSDGQGNGIAVLGRASFRWDDAGFYGAILHPTQAEAQREFGRDLADFPDHDEEVGA